MGMLSGQPTNPMSMVMGGGALTLSLMAMQLWVWHTMSQGQRKVNHGFYT